MAGHKHMILDVEETQEAVAIMDAFIALHAGDGVAAVWGALRSALLPPSGDAGGMHGVNGLAQQVVRNGSASEKGYSRNTGNSDDDEEDEDGEVLTDVLSYVERIDETLADLNTRVHLMQIVVAKLAGDTALDVADATAAAEAAVVTGKIDERLLHRLCVAVEALTEKVSRARRPVPNPGMTAVVVRQGMPRAEDVASALGLAFFDDEDEDQRPRCVACGKLVNDECICEDDIPF